MIGRVGQCVCVITLQIYLISKYFDNNNINYRFSVIA